MIKFSASPAQGGSKVFYKGYVEHVVDTAAELGAIALTHSISSYIYKAGITTGGEHCEGHKAGESVADAGTVLLYDFDAKNDRHMSLSALVEKLREVNALAWVGGSKSWSLDAEKLHLAVVIDNDLPMDKVEFAEWHRAVAQFLGISEAHDPAMESWTQQLAPSGEGGDRPNIALEGEPLYMARVFAKYVEPEAGVHSESRGITGEVGDDVEFTLSDTGEIVGIAKMLSLVEGGRKVRVHCLAGLKHDGREDTALVRGSEDGVAYYHCTGGRCGHTLALRDPEPFDTEEEEPPIVVKYGHGNIWSALENLKDIVMSRPCNMAAYNQKAQKTMKVSAVGLGLADLFAKRDVREIEGELQEFNGVMWEPLFTGNELFQWVQRAFECAGFSLLAGDFGAVKQVIELLKGSVPCGDLKEGAGKFLNLQNGMLCLDTMKLLPNDREQLFTTVLPFSFDFNAECPVWERLVDRIMLSSPALVESLRDALGYIFARSLYLELMVGLVGEGANGKSTVIEVMHRLVGDSASSSLSLHLLTKPSGEGAYARAGLTGKMVNFTSELSPSALMSNEFKELVSGVRIQARHPYGRSFTIPVAPKHICAMNTTQGLIKERTHGFMRRLHMIPFGYTVRDSDRDPYLMDKLDSELPGILNWMLVGTRRVMDTKALRKAPEMNKLLAQVTRDSNPVQQFLEERTESYDINFDDVLPKSKLWGMVVGVSEAYAGYKEFCEDNTYRPMGRNDFSRELERLGVTKLNESVKVEGSVKKASGFFLSMLKRSEWKDSPSNVGLKLVSTH